MPEVINVSPGFITLEEGYQQLGLASCKEVDAVAEALRWKMIAEQWELRARLAESRLKSA